MAEIIELELFRRKLAADQGFRSWLARFREEFGPQTRLCDLSDATLLFLATPGDDHLYVIFDLVMGARGWGTSTRFILDDLPSQTKQQVLDISLRLLDYCRFEVLRRLGWVEELPEAVQPLVVLVEALAATACGGAAPSPALRPEHPAFADYEREIPSERHIFIRRLIPSALAEFRQRVEAAQSSPPS
ncbi:MAG: hypothetical protein ACUVRZ_11700 [Desulfobacca sp.]|uniref:hypothetical protein n=1 Tax=Desulfobacca sp. TaxID=2067990 RepID=UPI00404A4834